MIRSERRSVLTVKRMMILIAVISLIAGCTAKFVPTTYKTLLAMEIFYDEAMKISADLYNRDSITAGQKEDIIKAAKIFRDSHDLMVRALAAYNESKGKNDYDKALLALQTCLKSYDSFVSIYSTVTKKAPPNTLPDRQYLEEKINQP